MRTAPALLSLALAGCLAHMPPDADPAHLHIDWRADVEDARAQARETGRPLLICLVAGGLLDSC